MTVFDGSLRVPTWGPTSKSTNALGRKSRLLWYYWCHESSANKAAKLGPLVTVTTPFRLTSKTLEGAIRQCLPVTRVRYRRYFVVSNNLHRDNDICLPKQKKKKEGGASDVLDPAISDHSQTRRFFGSQEHYISDYYSGKCHTTCFTTRWSANKNRDVNSFWQMKLCTSISQECSSIRTCETEFTATHVTKTEKSNVRNSLKCVFWKPICPQQSPFQINSNYRVNITSWGTLTHWDSRTF